MRKIVKAAGAVGLLSMLAGSVAVAAPAARRAAVATRKVQFKAVDAAAMVAVRAGRSVEGVVTFGSTLNGNPTGNATQACARVKVEATKWVPADNPNEFGTQVSVKKTSGTPVKADDISKGCNYKLAGLPGNQGLAISASYQPTTAWNPTCGGYFPAIATNQVETLTLPSAGGVKVTLPLKLDFMRCNENPPG